MPYKDPEKQRAAQAESYRRRYEASARFRREEALRKAEWLQTEEGRALNLAASHRALEKAQKGPLPKIRGKRR